MNRHSTGTLVVIVLAIILILCGCGYRTVLPGASGNGTVSATPSSAAPATHTASGKLTVHFLDVGQGDSEFTELPDGRTLLIDAGNPDDGANIVHYIKAAGYDTVDILVATHPHADHIGGMAEVVRNLNVRSVYMPKVTDTTKTYEDLLKAIKAKGLKISSAKAGVTLADADGLKITMLAPVSSGYDDLNNYSAVLKLIYKQTSFLFMGDAQKLAENEILKSGADLSADVLKVGHHGSDTSTGKAFLQAVSPTIAVISVGAGNDYGHPDAVTLANLGKAGVQVYRTYKNGTITITSDGRALTETTEKKS